MRTNPLKPVYDAINATPSEKKLSHLPEFPRIIDIELTNVCNMHCLMCPTGTGSFSRPQGFMSDDVYESVLNQAAWHGTPLRYIRWGEPTLHPKIVEYLAMAHEKGVITHINTNGKKLPEEMMRAFIELPLDSIKFSFQGVDAKSYREMRNDDRFEELLDKIRTMHALRGDAEKPYIHVATTITYETMEQVEAFKNLMEPHADLVTVGRTAMDYVPVDKVKLSEKERRVLAWLKGQESIVKKHVECPEVFDKLSVNWDGSVSACCSDFDNKMVIGNVLESPMKEIWMSKKMQTYRKLLAEMRHDELPLCKDCYDTMSLVVPGIQKIR